MGGGPDAGLAVLPDTVHAVLSARLDWLPPDEKRAIQEASVVGRSFWAEPVARALPQVGVSDCLAELERKGFLRAQPASSFAGQAEYQFRHALIRDVAYESLSRARRARAHAEVAAWMTSAAGGRAEEVAELVAHHYSAAVTGDADLAWFDEPDRRDAIADRAFDALRFAGTVARRRYAVQRAVELHEQAIALAPAERPGPRRSRRWATTTTRSSTAMPRSPPTTRRSRCSGANRRPRTTGAGSA